MKISIITICFNAETTIEQTLLSVIDQTYPDIEYILVDGGSKDNTLKIIEKHRDRISAFISEKDKGLYDALNKGLALATGNVIGVLHSDDFYIHRGVIQQVADTFTKTACDAVYSDMFYVDQENTNKIVRKWKSGRYKEGSFYFGWMPPHPTFFVKKTMYDEYGIFNAEFKTAGDYELMLRFIHKFKIKLAYLPEYTVKMRVGGKSNVSIQNRINANLEDRKAWEINGLKPKFFTLFLKPLRKIVQYF